MTTALKIDGHYLPYIGEVEHNDPRCMKVLQIVARLDDTRISFHGGYPARVAFIGTEYVAVASIEGSREPVLTVSSIEEFIAAHDWMDEEDEEP